MLQLQIIGGFLTMKNQLREAMEKQKEYYITKLLEENVYKVQEKQLYHLTISELKTIYKKLASIQHST